MMRALKRFLISSSLAPQMKIQSKSNTVVLPREETHHLKNVLRMKEGELCLLFDSEGHEFVSRIERYRPDEQSEVSLLDAVSQKNKPAFNISIAQAIPQDRKMDEIARQATELGVYELIPLITERTVVRIQKDKAEKVIQRWQRIADQTLKQCRLGRSPKIQLPVEFEVLSRNFTSYRNIFILDTDPGAIPIKELGSEKLDGVLLLIGPEGGFSPREIKQAEASGARRVSLGEGILKTDTAFVAAAAFFKLINL